MILPLRTFEPIFYNIIVPPIFSSSGAASYFPHFTFVLFFTMLLVFLNSIIFRTRLLKNTDFKMIRKKEEQKENKLRIFKKWRKENGNNNPEKDLFYLFTKIRQLANCLCFLDQSLWPSMSFFCCFIDRTTLKLLLWSLTCCHSYRNSLDAFYNKNWQVGFG